MSSDKIIDWKVVYEDVNPLGSFTCQIVWLPPAGVGFIVQHVSVDDERAANTPLSRAARSTDQGTAVESTYPQQQRHRQHNGFIEETDDICN